MYSNNLKFLRARNGYTQKDIANLINITGKAYGHYENEDDIIPIEHLSKICDFYNVSLDYIFNFNDRKYNLKNIVIDKKEVGKRLKEMRKEIKVTQSKLALVLNTNQSVIANYEAGRYLISTPFLYTICKKYNISADYLLGKIDNPKYL